MYKLTVVAGPNRGTSFAIRSGETSIGRQAGNGIVLQSSRVSKRHCVLVVDNLANITVKDQGSANGTFVNGVLTRTRDLQPGDRISVGDFVLEVTQPPVRAPRPAPAVGGFGNVLQFPVAPNGADGLPAARGLTNPALGMPAIASGGADAGMPALGGESAPSGPPPVPSDLIGKLLWYFETYVMPVFYGLNLKHQWKFICIGIFAAFILINLTLAIDPLLDANRSAVIAELGKRARFMARQIAESNAPIIAARTESKADIGLAGTASGVRIAVLTDMENRILAPGARFNQYLTNGAEARAARKAAEAFRAGKETGLWLEMGENTWVAIEPLKVYQPTLGRNLVAGMAIVSMDTEIATMQLGEISTVYSQVLIIMALLGALALYIMYRLTLKPFQVLGEDLDRALKGDIPQVTREFKLEELAVVWDLINSALQRIPKSSSAIDAEKGNDSGVTTEDYLGIAKMIASSNAKAGVALLNGERKFVYLNEMFEEITGIRGDAARGQEIGTVARDNSLGAFTEDLLGRVQPGGDPVAEGYEFSGANFLFSVSAVGKQGEATKGYLLVLARSDA